MPEINPQIMQQVAQGQQPGPVQPPVATKPVKKGKKGAQANPAQTVYPNLPTQGQ
ncbi:hypothetical protein LT85_1016 [Collimonas arenae]|uniref:Uncharacterized protein n=1 Tax=Collimonas arenae TaxID=279058 RepID=A0A0A1F915_9BURK|nr:hypothetical protein [Collimonas arenae]AIY40174.1 hypothetical protein LT85_1016 [Collimonas arenae]